MDLSQLRAFVKIVQARSYTRAADELQTQKGHLSRTITQLERELGVKLLERTTRTLSLTEVGREIFERAVGILAAVDETENLAQQVHGEPRGVLRMTCGTEFGMLAVSRWINGYLERYPDVSVDADFTSRVIDVVHEGFDLAIRLGPLQESRLAARQIGKLSYGLYAAPAYVDRHGLPGDVDALPNHALLLFSTGSHRSGWRLRRNDREVRIDSPARLRVNNIFAVRNAAMAALGIAQLPTIVAAVAESAGKLIRVLREWEPEQVPVHAVFASSRYLTPKVRRFIDHAIANFPTAINDVAPTSAW
jgi:DNA-binding transcriptional LysR family regulator